jgi:hypothetical protein
MVSREEREAYERGQDDREAQDNPIGYLLTPPEWEGDTEAEREAFDKGLSGEQLDGDKNR